MFSRSLFKNNYHFPPAILALSDGTTFPGISIGIHRHVVAEVVFNTAMTGYQEMLTDPSYYQQIIALTYPHIGNTGINLEDNESFRIHAKGLIIRDCSILVSNFRSSLSLPDYLTQEGIVAIAGVDTRKLTRILIRKGTQRACIYTGNNPECAIDLAGTPTNTVNQDLAGAVSLKKSQTWNEGVWQLGHGFSSPIQNGFHVVAYDFGVKRNILRSLVECGCRITQVHAYTCAEEVISLKPDGILLSNGPGNPESYGYAVRTVRAFLKRKIPLLGICLGCQIIGLALGGKTIKMKNGHHGTNHPVQDLNSKRVFITSQNHGFTVDIASLPHKIRVTHVSLFDGTLQGFKTIDNYPVLCFQGHPEANPGPQDISGLFDQFIHLMSLQK